MRIVVSAAACLIVLLTAGCGGNSDGAIRSAIESSKVTYFAYASPTWWGRPVTVKISTLTAGKETAEAAVDVYAGTDDVAHERVFLVRHDTGWEVSSFDRGDNTASVLLISGPENVRSPNAAERAELTSTTLNYLAIPASCVRLTIQISKLNSAYAAVSERFVGPNAASCSSNGVSIFWKVHGHWRLLGSSSEAFDCRTTPTGVVRSLLGNCAVYGSNELG